ncbi:MAG TPA: nitroreductase family protein [Acetobacteraceae bacterium]
MTDIGLFEAMYTTRALRRLKPDPVPDALIAHILEAGTRAGSAGNAQNWAFIVVRDAEQRRKLGAIYRRASDISEVIYAARGRPAHLTEEQYRAFMTAGAHLWDHMGEAPVLLVPCVKSNTVPAAELLPVEIRARYDALRDYQQLVRGASIYPAVQNIILACRALGLATLITTNHLYYEAELKEVLGIPDDMFPCALMPIGWPLGKFGPVSRRPLSEVAFADRWGSPLTK